MATDVTRVVPRGDQVLIRRKKKRETTVGGIFLPEQHRDEFFMAEVLAIGPGGYGDISRQPPDDLTVGDTVLVLENKKAPRGPSGEQYGPEQRHMLPVTEDEQVVLLLDTYIVAIEKKEA